jgi:thioredoxin 1
MKTKITLSFFFLLTLGYSCVCAQEKQVVKKKGMSLKQYKTLIRSDQDQWILVDFYADWCGPCKRMDPFLEEIKKEMGSKLRMVRINADDNTTICNELSVYSLPTLFLYKKEQMYWFNSGYVGKEEIVSHMR